MYLSSYKKYIFDVTTSRHHLRCEHQTANNLSFSLGLNTVFPDCLGTKQTLDTYSLLLLSAAVRSSGLLETYKGTAEGIYLPPVWTQRIASVMGNWGSHPLVLPMGLEWGGGDSEIELRVELARGCDAWFHMSKKLQRLSSLSVSFFSNTRWFLMWS